MDDMVLITLFSICAGLSIGNTIIVYKIKKTMQADQILVQAALNRVHDWMKTFEKNN